MRESAEVEAPGDLNRLNSHYTTIPPSAQHHHHLRHGVYRIEKLTLKQCSLLFYNEIAVWSSNTVDNNADDDDDDDYDGGWLMLELVVDGGVQINHLKNFISLKTK